MYTNSDNPLSPGTGAASLPAPQLGKNLWDFLVPEDMQTNAESLRRCRLHIRFGWLGAMFGACFALFYLILGHYYGAGIVIACSLVMAAMPLVLKATSNLSLTGHLYAGVLLLGFAGLCATEGGLRGHAVGWLAAVPLCVLLLLPWRAAMVWTVVCVLAVLAFAVADLSGIIFPKTYPAGHAALIDAVGYAALVPFMALVGVIFERTRARAFSQLQEAVQNVSEANHRLRKMNEEMSEFLNIAAHDLKNPLCGIRGHAELLTMMGPPEPQEVEEATATIIGLSNRMLDIIANLLDVRKIEDGAMEVKSECCAVDRLVQGVLQDYSQRAAAKQITLRFEALGHPPAKGDPGAIQQILDNLISNAIKYSPPGRPVACSCVEEGAMVRIEVADEGPGLSEEDQKKLFGKFTRLTPQPTGGESSNGLGLWIVQRMAQAMGGQVTCRSQVGRGSVFSLALPRWSGA